MSNDEASSSQLYEQVMKQSKRFGMPVELNIKKFKKHIRSEYPTLSKSELSYLGRRYKERAWDDYDSMVSVKWAEPSRNIKKKKEDNGK